MSQSYSSSLIFRPIDAAQLRIAAIPASSDPIVAPTVTEPLTPVEVASGAAWIRREWTDPCASAVRTASPDLARLIEAIIDGEETRPKRVRRAVESLHRYLLRFHGRATPFGLFAGVAPASFGDACSMQSATASTVRHADSVWLDRIARVLESDAAVLERLPVMANNLAHRRGSRLVVPYSPGPSDSEPVPEITVRWTDALRCVLDSAAAPVDFSDLAQKVIAEFPGLTFMAVAEFLRNLVKHRVLITALRRPAPNEERLDAMLAVLAESGADRVPSAAGPVEELRHVQQGIRNQVDEPSGPTGGREQHASVGSVGDAKSAEQPVVVETRAGVEATLPDAVAEEAAAAAAALLRLSPYPEGLPTWRGWHDRFLEYFGVGVPVPVRQVVGPGGIGFPAGYADHTKHQESGNAERDAWLLSRLQRAMMDGSNEIRLTDADFAEVGPVPDGGYPAHVELIARLEASDTVAVDRGDFRLVVHSAPRAAGAVTGRFVDLLDGHGAEALARLPVDTLGAVPAQVSFTPLRARAANVARSVKLLPFTINLGEHWEPQDDVIGVDDLAVVADWSRLYLVSLSRRCIVEPTALNALNFLTQVPPMARFLCELPRAHQAVFSLLGFGPAGALTFLPRVTYRKTLLSPATWRLRASELPSDTALWGDAFADWCRRWRVPDRVCLREADRHLRLDLSEPSHRAVVRSRLSAARTIALIEGPQADADGWTGGRAHEIAFPLARSSQPMPAPTIVWDATATQSGTRDAPRWCYVKLITPSRVQDQILREHLPSLLESWSSNPPWWFARFENRTGPQLRLRIAAAEYASAVESFERWARRLAEAELIADWSFPTYRPEIGRYGAGLALHAAERFFCVDSQSARAQLEALDQTGFAFPRRAVIAASMVDLACSFLGSIAAGMRWLVEHFRGLPRTPTNRAEAHAAARLVDAAVLAAAPGGEAIVSSWSLRREAAKDYRAQFDTEPIVRDEVLTSLLHMHHNRVVGIDRNDEQACIGLARATALSWLNQNKEDRT